MVDMGDDDEVADMRLIHATSGREANTVLRPSTAVARWPALLLTVSALALAACQAASGPTPTSTPAPTSARTPTSAAAVQATPAATAPSLAPTVARPAASPSPSSNPAAAAATPPPTGASRVEVLNAADAAFQRGDVATAEGLYSRVINTPPSASETAEATAAINQLAYFRAMLSFMAEGRDTDAKAQLDALNEHAANTPLARIAAQVWDQYGMTGQLRSACAQAQPAIA